MTSKIIDGHCHAACLDFIPQAFIDGVIDNMRAALAAQGVMPPRRKLTDLYLKNMQDPECDELVSQMDQAGVAQAVLLLPDFTYVCRDMSLTIAEMFERHARILRKWPGRFFVLAGVDPRWGADGIELFERGITEFGFSGLKLYPPCGYSPSDEMLYPFYEVCSRRRVPVVSHTGGTSPALSFDTFQPALVDRAARNFPGVNFILAHGTGAGLEECVMLCHFRPNVFVDVSGYEDEMDRLRLLMTRRINHKLIFGTDWPVFRMRATLKDVLHTLVSDGEIQARLSGNTLQNFMGDTIYRLLVENVDISSRG